MGARVRRTRHIVAIGLDLGGTNVRAGIVSGKGRLLQHISLPTAVGRKPKVVTDQMARLIELFLGIAREKNALVKGIGIGVPGFMDLRRGIILSSPNFPLWRSYPLGARLRRLFKLPIYFENDANAAALGEQWIGAGKGKENIVCLTLGTGVGGGVISDGHLLRGARGAGGEVGHMVIDPKGSRCGCGGRGCLETLASGTALHRLTGKYGDELASAANKGDRAARSAFARLGKNLGIGLSSLSFFFDPEVIILGGHVSQAIRFFAPAMKKEMKERLRNHPSRNVEIRLAKCGDHAGILGAARSVFST